MRIKSALLAAAVVAAGAVVVAGAGTAEAAPCTYDNACLWSNANFSGYRFNNFNSQPSWANISYNGTSIRLYRGDGVYTNVSSLDNHDPNSRIAVYYNSGYRGPCFTVEAGGSVDNFAHIWLIDFQRANDRMNSHRFNVTCGAVYDD